MPTVMRIGPFRFYFYSHEPNEPPHIHVDRGEATIKVLARKLGGREKPGVSRA